MRYSVESIHGDLAALCGDDGTLLQLPVMQLPGGTTVGDVLERQPDGSFVSLPQLARRRAARAMALFRKLERRR